MSEIKTVAASIVNFLKRQLETDSLNMDSRESVEVGVQCIETAFELEPEDAALGVNLLQLIRQQRPPSSKAKRAEAELLKQEGNELMKREKYREALEKYTCAIELDPTNPVCFCNRAASHFKLDEHEAAVADCTAALALQPDYAKAHGRLGLALTALERHRQARIAYARASELEPENESYRRNLRVADERLAQRGDHPPLDLCGIQQNNALLNTIEGMFADPNVQNFVSGILGERVGEGGILDLPGADAGGISALMELGQAVTQHMEATNPELLEQVHHLVKPPASPQ